MARDTTFMDKRPNSVKVSVLPNWTYRFKANPIKLPAGFFTETNYLVLKRMQKCKGPIIAKAILKRQLKDRGPAFKTYYKATASRSYELA